MQTRVWMWAIAVGVAGAVESACQSIEPLQSAETECNPRAEDEQELLGSNALPPADPAPAADCSSPS